MLTLMLCFVVVAAVVVSAAVVVVALLALMTLCTTILSWPAKGKEGKVCLAERQSISLFEEVSLSLSAAN